MTPPIPALSAVAFGDGSVPTCLSNGVVGLTPGANPLLHGRVLASGFVFSHPLYGMECIAPAPYPLGMDLRISGWRLRESPGSVQTHSQALFMESGELLTRMGFTAAGQQLELEVLQFASRSVPCLLCQELSVLGPSDTEMELEVSTLIDTAGLPGQAYTGDTDPFTRGWYSEDRADRCVGFATDRGRIGIATVVERGPGVRRKGPGEYTLSVRAGQPAVFRIIAALVPDTSSPEPHLEAVRMARWGDMLGFPALRRDNRDAWAELWKSRIRITGSADDQRALDTAFYYYHSSIHPSTRGGIPPFGLAHHDKYYGHVFWDMDMWMLLPAILTAPGSARAIAEFRLRGLDAARRRAALFGCRGAQFPWEASFEGVEVTPSCCPTGWGEQHVTPGVAIGAWEFQQAAGNRESLRSVTWPILQAVAEWIESRGHFTDRGFEVGHMMGPDEGITDLSNQTYFNLLSKMAMAAALDCARLSGRKPPSSWQRIRDRMVVPRQGDIVLPFDPGSVDAYSLGNLQYLFLHGCPVDERLFRATWHHEEKLRLERLGKGGVPGSSNAVGFTTPPWAVCAAYFGDRQKAADLFLDSWKSYWTEPFGMVKEAPSQDYGGFVTNHGSLLQSALMGFTGLRIRDGDWARYPASLPAGWERIEVDRVWVRGRPMALAAVQGKKAVLKPREG